MLTTQFPRAAPQLNHQREGMPDLTPTDVVSWHALNPAPVPVTARATLPLATGPKPKMLTYTCENRLAVLTGVPERDAHAPRLRMTQATTHGSLLFMWISGG